MSDSGVNSGANLCCIGEKIPVSRLFGSSLLIAGCCIGAGMLGMPVLSGPFGFFPTLAMFAIGITYMLISGFVLTDLLVDAAQRGEKHTHLLSLSESILGKSGKTITWILFGFLFYAVLTAYTIGIARLIQEMATLVLPVPYQLSQSVIALLVVICTSLIISKKVSFIDITNRMCFFGLVSVYLCLLVIASTEFETSRLFRAYWGVQVFTTLPVIAFSFGYHNLLPTIVTYLDYDRKQIKKAIVIGVTLPLFVYIVWEMIIFGVVPFSSYGEWLRFIQSGEMITAVIYESVKIPAFIDMTRLFAFFAIITSYLTVGMSMTDFLQDGISKYQSNNDAHPKKTLGRFQYVLLALVPPYIIGIIDPTLFLTALSYSGGVIAMLLFGILPAILSLIRSPVAVGDNKLQYKTLTTFVLIVGALFIMGIEIGQRLGLKIAHS